MRRVGIVFVSLLLPLHAACDPRGEHDGTEVVATLAPLAELARGVGGDRVQVLDLTPQGGEPHDLELRPRDVDAIERADVVLYLGGGFQPAVDRVAPKADRPVNLLAPGEADPHIWLDPVRMSEAVATTEEALARADPEGRPAYRDQAAAFRAQLEQLHAAYEGGLNRCARRLIVTSHDSFRRLAERYGLEAEAVTGVAPEAEPEPARLAELADLVRRRGLTTVFTEPAGTPRVAEALAREAGVRTAVLDPLEGRTEGGYVAGMERNLAALRAALECT